MGLYKNVCKFSRIFGTTCIPSLKPGSNWIIALHMECRFTKIIHQLTEKAHSYLLDVINKVN